MSQVKQKVIPRAKVETITRAKLLQNTASEVLHLFKDYSAFGAQWLIDRLPVIIQHELVNGFELVAYNGDEPVTSIEFNINWNDHSVQKTIKNEIDECELENGKTHVSTREVVDVVSKYLAQVNESVPGVHYEVWYKRNTPVRKQLGAEKYYELLGCEGSVEKERADARQYRVVRLMKAARKLRKVFFPGLEESSMEIR